MCKSPLKIFEDSQIFSVCALSFSLFLSLLTTYISHTNRAERSQKRKPIAVSFCEFQFVILGRFRKYRKLAITAIVDRRTMTPKGKTSGIALLTMSVETA